MTDQTISKPTAARLTGGVLVLTALAIVALFLLHPAEHEFDYASMVKEEAANRAMNAIVHGGFVAILGIQLACFAIFSGRAGWQRSSVIAALVFYAVGSVLRASGILFDGVIVPALAAHYVSAPANIVAAARSTFVLCEVLNQWLGFSGSAFQAAGVLAWGIGLTAISRAGGIVTILLGVAMAAILAASLVMGAGLAMLTILGLILWTLIAGTLLIVRIV